VLLGDEKVAGILIESESGGATGIRRAVAGFGVNVVHAPGGLGATHLSAHAPGVTADALFSDLAPAVVDVMARLAAPGGVAALRERWRAAAVGIGAPVTVRFENRTKDGLFVDLDEAGRLMLKENDGTVTRITAGDVFVRAETP